MCKNTIDKLVDPNWVHFWHFRVQVSIPNLLYISYPLTEARFWLWVRCFAYKSIDSAFSKFLVHDWCRCGDLNKILFSIDSLRVNCILACQEVLKNPVGHIMQLVWPLWKGVNALMIPISFNLFTCLILYCYFRTLQTKTYLQSGTPSTSRERY